MTKTSPQYKNMKDIMHTKPAIARQVIFQDKKDRPQRIGNAASQQPNNTGLG